MTDKKNTPPVNFFIHGDGVSYNKYVKGKKNIDINKINEYGTYRVSKNSKGIILNYKNPINPNTNEIDADFNPLDLYASYKMNSENFKALIGNSIKTVMMYGKIWGLCFYKYQDMTLVKNENLNLSSYINLPRRVPSRPTKILKKKFNLLDEIEYLYFGFIENDINILGNKSLDVIHVSMLNYNLPNNYINLFDSIFAKSKNPNISFFFDGTTFGNYTIEDVKNFLVAIFTMLKNINTGNDAGKLVITGCNRFNNTQLKELITILSQNNNLLKRVIFLRDSLKNDSNKILPYDYNISKMEILQTTQFIQTTQPPQQILQQPQLPPTLPQQIPQQPQQIIQPFGEEEKIDPQSKMLELLMKIAEKEEPKKEEVETAEIIPEEIPPLQTTTVPQSPIIFSSQTTTVPQQPIIPIKPEQILLPEEKEYDEAILILYNENNQFINIEIEDRTEDILSDVIKSNINEIKQKLIPEITEDNYKTNFKYYYILKGKNVEMSTIDDAINELVDGNKLLIKKKEIPSQPKRGRREIEPIQTFQTIKERKFTETEYNYQIFFKNIYPSFNAIKFADFIIPITLPIDIKFFDLILNNIDKFAMSMGLKNLDEYWIKNKLVLTESEIITDTLPPSILDKRITSDYFKEKESFIRTIQFTDIDTFKKNVITEIKIPSIFTIGKPKSTPIKKPFVIEKQTIPMQKFPSTFVSQQQQIVPVQQPSMIVSQQQQIVPMQQPSMIVSQQKIVPTELQQFKPPIFPSVILPPRKGLSGKNVNLYVINPIIDNEGASYLINIPIEYTFNDTINQYHFEWVELLKNLILQSYFKIEDFVVYGGYVDEYKKYGVEPFPKQFNPSNFIISFDYLFNKLIDKNSNLVDEVRKENKYQQELAKKEGKTYAEIEPFREIQGTKIQAIHLYVLPGKELIEPLQKITFKEEEEEITKQERKYEIVKEEEEEKKKNVIDLEFINPIDDKHLKFTIKNVNPDKSLNAIISEESKWAREGSIYRKLQALITTYYLTKGKYVPIYYDPIQVAKSMEGVIWPDRSPDQFNYSNCVFSANIGSVKIPVMDPLNYHIGKLEETITTRTYKIYVYQDFTYFDKFKKIIETMLKQEEEEEEQQPISIIPFNYKKAEEMDFKDVIMLGTEESEQEKREKMFGVGMKTINFVNPLLYNIKNTTGSIFDVIITKTTTFDKIYNLNKDKFVTMFENDAMAMFSPKVKNQQNKPVQLRFLHQGFNPNTLVYTTDVRNPKKRVYFKNDEILWDKKYPDGQLIFAARNTFIYVYISEELYITMQNDRKFDSLTNDVELTLKLKK